MSNAFSRVALYAKGLVFPVGVLFSVFSGSLHATVTWDGDEGVEVWLTNAPQTPSGSINCTQSGCHNSTGLGRDFTSYSSATSGIGGATGLAERIITRLGLPASDPLCMPQGNCNTVNSSFIATWKDQVGGPVENAAPSMQSINATTIDRTSATLNGAVNANGRNTWYVLEWGLDDGGMNFPNQIPLPPQQTSNTNGGLNAEGVNQPLSDLTCETAYQFRIGATNDDPITPPITYTYNDDPDDPKEFITGDCNFPVVRFGGSQVSGVGETVVIPVVLDSDTSTVFEYPINIQYEVSGTAAPGDFDLTDGALSINAPDTSGNLTFNIIANTSAPADETVVIEVTAATDSGGNPNATVPTPSEYTVVITGNNSAPQSPPLQVSQDGLNTQYVYKNKWEVTITANSGAGQFSYDWSATDPRLPGEATGNQYTFDPLDSSVPTPGLTPGAYVVSVEIEGGQQTIHQTITLWLGESAPSLSCGPDDDADGNGICNEIEGYGDFDFDGLPDYQDPIGDPSLLNREVSSAGDNQARLITTIAGLSLALNGTAVELVANGEATGAKLSADDVIDDPDFSTVSSVFDFQIRGLSDTQRTAQVVIPLDNPIPPGARYRKLINGVWSDFIETSTDGIRSAKSDETNNECPPLGDPLYRDELIAFNDCLELTLTDGGPNDADGEANGVIKDPGAVVLPASVPSGSTTSPDASSSPGGAGALDWWWLMMLTPLLWLPYRLKKGQVND